MAHERGDVKGQCLLGTPSENTRDNGTGEGSGQAQGSATAISDAKHVLCMGLCFHFTVASRILQSA